MYPLSEAFLQAVQENSRRYFWTGRITTKKGVIHEFGPEDIEKGSGYISSQPTKTCSKTTLWLLQEYSDYISDGVLTKNLEFDSPSGAANFMTRRSTNGNIAWVIKKVWLSVSSEYCTTPPPVCLSAVAAF